MMITNFLSASTDSVFSFLFRNEVTITANFPTDFSAKKKTQIVLFALPNGNTTAQTMGHYLKAGG
jgi:hypothetical protein